MQKRIRKGLTPARILDVAYALVDKEGAEALSMRRLAASLGVAPMALYNHFSDRDNLLNALADRALESAAVHKGHGNWRQKLTSIVEGVHRLALRHPHLYALAMTRPTKPSAAFALMSSAMAALREAGLSDLEVINWYHTFLLLLQGYPSWSGSMARYGESTNIMPLNVKAPAGLARDLKLLHSVNAERQFKRSLKVLLDALELQANSARD